MFSRINRLYLILLAIIAALVMLCAVGLIVLAAVPDGSSAKTGLPADSDEPSVILSQTPDAGDGYINKIIFVGDSNIAHLASPSLGSLVPENQIWTGEGSFLTLERYTYMKTIVYPDTGADMTIAAAAGLKKPEYMIITLGTNGASSLDEDGFKGAYKSLINSVKEASPGTKLMVQSIFPVTSCSAAEPKFPDPASANRKFDTANGWLREVAAECGIKYLDTQSVLKDTDGMMIKSYNSFHNDGYHLNGEGLAAVINYIKTHAYK